MPRRRQVRRVDKSICQKCRQTKSMYIIRNVTFCKTCFEAAVFSRFTKSLHPPLKSPTSSRSAASSGYRPPAQSGSALIALSTGCGSTTLLDLLLTRRYIGKGDDRVVDKTKGEKEPVWRKGWVCYVDFSSVVGEIERQGEGQGQREGSRMEEVKKWVEGRENGLGWAFGWAAYSGRQARGSGAMGCGSQGPCTPSFLSVLLLVPITNTSHPSP